MEKYVNSNGRCHIDMWLKSSRLTKRDRAKLDGRITKIEAALTTIPAEWVKKYRTTRLFEIKVKGDSKQLRPLCVKRPDKRIILLCGAIEKDSKIPQGILDRAEQLFVEFEKGLGHVERYY